MGGWCSFSVNPLAKQSLFVLYFRLCLKICIHVVRDIIICTRREIWIAISVFENSMAFSTFGDPF